MQQLEKEAELGRKYLKGLREEVETAMQTVADRIAEFADVVYPGMIDTLDKSDEAGRLFAREGVEMVVIAQGTYCVDYLIHQALLHLPDELPLVLFASQMHNELDFAIADKALFSNLFCFEQLTRDQVGLVCSRSFAEKNFHKDGK